jgi:hypothetical protein
LGCSTHELVAGEGFKYVGGSHGYFLSKYDWREHNFEQMTDCTPGDIRVHFTAQFVDVASMMGTVHPTEDLLTTQAVKVGGSSKETYNFGVVHKGALSAQEMLKRELEEGRYAWNRVCWSCSIQLPI